MSKRQAKLEPKGDGTWATGSMLEELVPEIALHVMSYLDFKSLCQLSKTNSVMRRAANDDWSWKSLYHKDFTTEQTEISPASGWKAYYAATKPVIDVNEDWYEAFRGKSLKDMSHLWLKADYVKCMHPGGGIVTGYDEVLQSWEILFDWDRQYNIQVHDVRVRVSGDMAWVTLKEFINAAGEPLLVTNIYELHDGKWFMVHHHSSPNT